MKKYVIALAAFLAVTSTAHAVPTTWDWTGSILRPLQSMWGGTVQVPSITATSTTATNTLPVLDVPSRFSFGGIVGSAWSDFCVAITGGSGLCDGSDDGAGGGGLATTSPWNVGEATFVASDGAVGSVATGTLTETVTGLSLDNTRGLFGGSAQLSLDSGYTIPTTTLISALSAFNANPASRCIEITGSASLCDGVDDTAAGGSGLATTAPWTVGELAQVASQGAVRSIATSSLGLSPSFTTSAALAALLSDETGTGAAVFGTSPNFLGTPTIQGWAMSTSTVVCMAPEVCQFQADGVADDVTIQAALQAVENSGGGLVTLKRGEYLLSDPINWLWSSTTLTGEDKSTTIIKGVNVSAIQANTENAFVKIRNLTIRTTGGVQYKGVGIEQNQDITVNYRIEDNVFNTVLNAILINNGTSTAKNVGVFILRNNEFIDSSSNPDGSDFINDDYGLGEMRHVVWRRGRNATTTPQIISGNIFNNQGTYSTAKALYVVGDTTSGFGLNESAVRFVSIENNRVYNAYDGIYLADSRNSQVISNSVYNSGRIPFSLIDSYANTYMNNVVDTAVQRGYRLQTSSLVTFIGNTSVNTGAGDSSAGALLIANLSSSTISGNTFNADLNPAVRIQDSTNILVGRNAYSGSFTTISRDATSTNLTIEEPNNFGMHYPLSTVFRTGSMMIGTSTNPNELLTIWSNTSDNHLSLNGVAPSLHFRDQAADRGFIALATSDSQFYPAVRDNDIIFQNKNPMRWIISTTTVLKLNANGNFGIATETPTTKLYVNATDGDGIGLGDRAVDGTIWIGRTASGLLTGNSAKIGFLEGTTNGWGEIAFNTNGGINAAERMRIDRDGNVGIGTTSPSARLTISGDMRLTGRFADSSSSTGALGSVLTATANGTAWVATSSLGISGGGAGTVYLATTSTWATGNLARVASDGTVDSVATSSLGLSSIFTTSAQLAALLSDETGTGLAVFSANPALTGTTTAENATFSGNVGIGTASPTTKLFVNATNGDGISLGDRTTNGTTWIGRTASGLLTGNSAKIGFLEGTTNGWGEIVFHTNGINAAERMRIDRDGMVGIGTTSPTSTLAVVGSSGRTLLELVGSAGTKFMEMLNTGITVLLGAWDFGGADSLEIVNGTNPTIDATGEIALDTTDNQLIMADSSGTARVFAMPEFRVVNMTFASTSYFFFNGGSLPVGSNKDGLELTQYRCFVTGGTSVVLNLSDGTNDTETITCGTSVTSDTDVATNDTFTADEAMYLEVGAITGSVNAVHFEAYARITRE